jgi:hypothetical protein
VCGTNGVGDIRELRVEGLSIQPFEDLWFDKRKIRTWKGSSAKAAYFAAREDISRAQSTV